MQDADEYDEEAEAVADNAVDAERPPGPLDDDGLDGAHLQLDLQEELDEEQHDAGGQGGQVLPDRPAVNANRQPVRRQPARGQPAEQRHGQVIQAGRGRGRGRGRRGAPPAQRGGAERQQPQPAAALVQQAPGPGAPAALALDLQPIVRVVLHELEGEIKRVVVL